MSKKLELEQEPDHFEEFAQMLDEGKELGPDVLLDSNDDIEPEAMDEDTVIGEPEDFIAEEDTIDVWQGASDEQRQALEALNTQLDKATHDAHSARHSQSVLQKRLNSQQVPAPASDPLGLTANPVAAPVVVEETPELIQFKQDFPEISAAMDAMLKAQRATDQSANNVQLAELQKKLAEVSIPVQNLAEERNVQEIQAQLSELGEAHPDYARIQESPKFWDWLDMQPQGVQALSSSSRAADNIVLLNLFKDVPTPLTEGETPAKTPRAPRRPRRADGSDALPKSGGGRRSTSAPEGEGAFDYWADQVDRGVI